MVERQRWQEATERRQKRLRRVVFPGYRVGRCGKHHVPASGRGPLADTTRICSCQPLSWPRQVTSSCRTPPSQMGRTTHRWSRLVPLAQTCWLDQCLRKSGTARGATARTGRISWRLTNASKLSGTVRLDHHRYVRAFAPAAHLTALDYCQYSADNLEIKRSPKWL